MGCFWMHAQRQKMQHIGIGDYGVQGGPKGEKKRELARAIEATNILNEEKTNKETVRQNETTKQAQTNMPTNSHRCKKKKRHEISPKSIKRFDNKRKKRLNAKG